MADEKTFDDVLAFLEKRRARTVEDVFNEYLDEKPQLVANAVEVPVLPLPYPVHVEDFDGGTHIIPPTRLVTLVTEVEFPVCCISSWRPEDGSENRLMAHFTQLDTCRGTCLICGWDNGKPIPLTDEQAQFVCDVLAYAKILQKRGEL